MKKRRNSQDEDDTTDSFFVRLSDGEPSAGINFGTHVRRAKNDLLSSILSTPPSEEQLAYSGEPSLKAAKVLGEAKLATKSLAGLDILGDGGKIDTQAMRRANADWVEDRRRLQKLASSAVDASLGAPTADQLNYPEVAKKHPVSIKALDFFGDENLELTAKKQIPTDELPTLKALRVFGSASSLAPPKARKILGSSESDGEARALADKHWTEEMAKKAEEFTREILSRRPNQHLSQIPVDNGPVSEKALAFFGDNELQRRSLRACKSRAPPKAVQVLGEAGLAGRKAEALTGAIFDAYPPSPPKNIAPLNAPLTNYRKLFLSALQEA